MTSSFAFNIKTHSSRPRVGDPPLERNPLIVGPISVGVGAQENPPNVCHVIHTNCWAFKYVTVEEERVKACKNLENKGGGIKNRQKQAVGIHDRSVIKHGLGICEILKRDNKMTLHRTKTEGAGLSLPKYRNDRLELLPDCFQPLENRQEFGHATNKTEDLVSTAFQTPSNMFVSLCLSQMEGFFFAFNYSKKIQMGKAEQFCRKKRKWGESYIDFFYFRFLICPGQTDSNLSSDLFELKIWEFYRNIPSSYS